MHAKLRIYNATMKTMPTAIDQNKFFFILFLVAYNTRRNSFQFYLLSSSLYSFIHSFCLFVSQLNCNLFINLYVRAVQCTY